MAQWPHCNGTVGGMKKILLIDVDGTLIDSYPGIRASFIHALSTHGYAIPDEDFLRGLPGPPMRDSIAAAGVPAEQVETVMANYSKHQSSGGWLDSALFPGTTELLATWREEGHILATATSKSYTGALRALTHFGLLEYFDYLGTAEDNGGPRQHKEDVVAYVMGLINAEHETDPSQFLMIGDRKHDAQGAKSQGIDCVLVNWGYGSQQELAQVPLIANTTEELKSIVEQH